VPLNKQLKTMLDTIFPANQNTQNSQPITWLISVTKQNSTTV